MFGYGHLVLLFHPAIKLQPLRLKFTMSLKYVSLAVVAFASRVSAQGAAYAQCISSQEFRT